MRKARQDAQQVVVLGSGYTGTLAAIRVAGRARGRARVTLVGTHEALVQRLRLHELAAGHEIAAPPLAKLVKRRPIELVRGHATGIDLAAGRVEVMGEAGIAEHPFDRLVIATGSESDVSTPGVREHAHTCADLGAATRLRKALSDLPSGAAVAVGGGGLTGIEVVSEIAEARPDLRMRLVCSGPLGGWLSARPRAYLAEALARLGAEVVENSYVTTVERDRMDLADGGEVAFDLAVWCGGFVPAPLARESGLATDARGAVLVDSSMRSCSHPHVLAVGDACAPPPLSNGGTFRGTCQAGMPTGAHAADTIVAELRGREPKPLDFGWFHQPISLGRRDALIQFVDRDDTPRDRMLTGRTGAKYKDLVCKSAIASLKLERRIPGTTVWPGAGTPKDHAREESLPQRSAA